MKMLTDLELNTIKLDAYRIGFEHGVQSIPFESLRQQSLLRVSKLRPEDMSEIARPEYIPEIVRPEYCWHNIRGQDCAQCYPVEKPKGKSVDITNVPRINLTLAMLFLRELRNQIGSDKYAEVVVRNRAEDNPLVCHSHDFCDANMVMAAAWEQAGLPEFDAQDEAQCKTWGDAWQTAKEIALVE